MAEVGIKMVFRCMECSLDLNQQEMAQHLIDNSTHRFTQRVVRDDSSSIVISTELEG